MKKIKVRSVILAIILFFGSTNIIKAEAIDYNNIKEEDFEVVAENTKYFKTVTLLNNGNVLFSLDSNVQSLTTEISEEEYNNAPSNDGISPQASIETTYKKLTSAIAKYESSYYKYSATLVWKYMPSVRSYDTIGLGFIANVKPATSARFTQTYCTSDGTCNDAAGYYEYIGNNGVGATFHLPSGSLSSLKEYIYVIVKKTYSDATITEQLCVASYAHATQSVSYSEAKDYFIDTGGIDYNSNSKNKYNDIIGVQSEWTGKW